MITKAASIAGVDLDTSELAAAAAEFESRVDAAIEHNSDFADYVHQIEHDADIDPADTSGTGHLLVSEIEDFLRGSY